MAEFLTRLETSQSHNKEYEWRLEEHLVYVSDIVGPIVVPKGFVYDKNSVPFFMRWLFPVSGRRSDYAATLHDWIYTTELYPRAVCDCIYLEAMKLSEVPVWRAVTKYQAVAKFGWIVWGRHTKKTLDASRKLVDLKEMERVLEEHGLNPDAHQAWNLYRYPSRLGAI